MHDIVYYLPWLSHNNIIILMRSESEDTEEMLTNRLSLLIVDFHRCDFEHPSNEAP